MKKILIIGGGLSGLSAAIYLIQKGYHVEILEASPKLGGRTYSFTLDDKQTTIDNGQHILMGCYTHTLDYIDKINSMDKFYFQESLKINYVAEKGKTYKLSVPGKFYPLNLLYAFINFKLLTSSERISILKFFLGLRTGRVKAGNEQSVEELLRSHGQSESVIKKFWDNVVISAMNTSIELASAELFIEMIKIIFFSGKDSSNIIIPNTGLSEALIYPAENFIKNKGGKIVTSERVIKIEFENGKASKVLTSKREIIDFDYLISAITSDQLLKIIPDNIIEKLNIPSLQYSSILSVNLWLSKKLLKEKFYGIVGGKFHWLFNKGEYISLVKSVADDLIFSNKNDLIEIAISELKKYFTILTDTEIIDSKIIKERKATMISDVNSIKKRKKMNHNFNNLFIAGDWTNTGLPGTIESSVKSGRMISDMILSHPLK